MQFKQLFCLAIACSITACVSPVTKMDAFPEMYQGDKPESVIIVPVINKTTSAEAADYLNATIAQPLVNKGFYVLPVPVVSDIFKQSGVVDGTQLKGVPVKTYYERFGADAALFISLTNWETSYVVISGSVTVGMEYVLVSTKTGNILWSYANTLEINTGSSSSSLIVKLIETAINTATTDYVPIARQVHSMATSTLPVGKYHPLSGKDGEVKNVNLELAEQAKASFSQ